MCSDSTRHCARLEDLSDLFSLSSPQSLHENVIIEAQHDVIE